MEQQQKKKSILSGIQPTGVFTLGNYIGAVKNWGPMQDEFDCAYMIADLHRPSGPQDIQTADPVLLCAAALLRHRPGEEHRLYPEPEQKPCAAVLDSVLLYSVRRIVPDDPV